MSSRSGRLCACMLFNSDAFIFVYLPIVLAGFYAVVRMRAGVLAQVWLVAASLYFYAYWNVSFLPLLLASIAFNYLAGRVIARLRVTHQSLRTPALIGAVSCNLILLGYFKYAAFLQNTVAHLLSLPSLAENVPIPLGISFFTFTQIAYLVDVAYVDDAERSPISYALFVNFFPHLIAGPILHHRATIPQFVFSFQLKRAVENIAVGVTIFSFGLFKKVVLADGVAPYVLLAFSDKTHPQMCDAWTGVLAYTLQIYFDFSGYSDMAIGLARMFGVIFPLNFDSPYKATSIIDFWRRWHMTLSRFLRDYLYFPLGGNRSGGGQTVNIMITMLLGGLWHGAGLTFVIWGGLHGLYLLINHQWRQRRRQRSASVYHAALSGGLTFLSVVVAWVFFRASGIDQASTIISAMLGLRGLGSNGELICTAAGQDTCVLGVPTACYWIAALLAIAFFAPNSQQVMWHWKPALDDMRSVPKPSKLLSFAPTIPWAIVVGLLFAIAVVRLNEHSQFLYYQF